MSSDARVCAGCLFVCLATAFWILYMHGAILRSNRALMDCIIDHAGRCEKGEPHA